MYPTLWQEHGHNQDRSTWRYHRRSCNIAMSRATHLVHTGHVRVYVSLGPHMTHQSVCIILLVHIGHVRENIFPTHHLVHTGHIRVSSPDPHRTGQGEDVILLVHTRHIQEMTLSQPTHGMSWRISTDATSNINKIGTLKSWNQGLSTKGERISLGDG